jgi:hypothetical protein
MVMRQNGTAWCNGLAPSIVTAWQVAQFARAKSRPCEISAFELASFAVETELETIPITRLVIVVRNKRFNMAYPFAKLQDV